MDKSIRSTHHQVKDLPDSLQRLIADLDQSRDLKPSRLCQYMLNAQVQSADLLPWAHFDHPEKDSYGRKLVYQGAHYELMVMSWAPGDFSAIHDHGYTVWGAVQVFGPAEHATFRNDGEGLQTLARWTMKSGDVVGVNHDLIHQMGNNSTAPFVSLHVYGGLSNKTSITGDARIFDPVKAEIKRVDGGVFFYLPDSALKKREAGPRGDFPTQVRFLVEKGRRLQKMQNMEEAIRPSWEDLKDLFLSDALHKDLLLFLNTITNDQGHITSSTAWNNLYQELKLAAAFQNELLEALETRDHFQRYASVYDSVIGNPCLQGFMSTYLSTLQKQFQLDYGNMDILSLGCGTGLVESYLIEALGANREKLYGIDISPGMIREAKKRIYADTGDLLKLDPELRTWDLAFSGLNVFHYIDHLRLEEAIQKTAGIIRAGGYYIGDFITPDHIRWYPNVIISEDKQVISLRNPLLIEEKGSLFQQSEIFNLQFKSGKMRIDYAGKHSRFLPPMHRVRMYFEKYFKGVVKLFDAHSMEEIGPMADSCSSTRYVVIAQK